MGNVGRKLGEFGENWGFGQIRFNALEDDSTVRRLTYRFLKLIKDVSSRSGALIPMCPEKGLGIYGECAMTNFIGWFP